MGRRNAVNANNITSHSYAGITRIRFEGLGGNTPDLSRLAPAPLGIVATTIAKEVEFVKAWKLWYTKREKGDKMENCFIFGAGTCYGLFARPGEGDYVIAADGGYLTCRKEGIVPDLVIGDFDSMEEPAEFPNRLRAPVEKDDTDTILAAKAGLENGYKVFHIYGGTGGKRLDHTLANLQLLLYLDSKGARGYLYDDAFVYTALRGGSLAIGQEVEWGLLSVFCFSGLAAGVCEEGVQYPLHDAVLTSDFPLGVSNHIIAPEAKVSVKEGSLIVGWELPKPKI